MPNIEKLLHQGTKYYTANHYIDSFLISMAELDYVFGQILQTRETKKPEFFRYAAV